MLTPEQIEALSPDTASLKAGKDLANNKKWVGLFYNERVLWAEIQGSGKDPYRTQIDLTNTAFKCSCPSRKFPCKHGLGAYLLFAKDTSFFTQTNEEPTWVKDWIDKRVQKEGKKAIAEAELISPEKLAKQNKVKEKSANERLLKVNEGVEELRLWLKDMLRAGFLSVPEKDSNYWQRTATRLIDAQARGLATWVKEISQINFYTKAEVWQKELLEKTSSLYLLLEAFRHLDRLPETLQEDIKGLVGIAKTQKELTDNNAETLRDTWLVLGKQSFKVEEDNLTGLRQWLYGVKSQKTALILDFTYGYTAIKNNLIPGTYLNAELVFYPSNYPFRAFIKSQGSISEQTNVQPDFLNSWNQWQNFYAETLALQPWINLLPAHITNLSLNKYKNQWYLVDAEKNAKLLDWNEKKIYKILANEETTNLSFSLIASPKQILPLGLWKEGKYYFL
jgi:hypothetical protein